MNSGKIQQVGTPEQIYRNPRTSYVASFIGETNLLAGKVNEVVGGGAVSVVTDAGELRGRITDDEWVPVAGEQAHASIRPEAVRISVGKGELQGTVTQTMYLGDTIQYRVRLVEGTEMQVSEVNPRMVLKEGTVAGLEFESEDVVILRD